MKARRNYLAIITIALAASVAGFARDREFLALTLLVFGLLPAMVLGATVKFWRPWFEQGMLGADDEPKTSFFVLQSLIFDGSTAAFVWLYSPHAATAILIRFALLFFQLLALGKLRAEVKLDPSTK